MTLVSDIITDAYREVNLIPIGATPSANQQTEGLRRLQAIINALMGTDAGEFLVDWPLGDFGRQALDQKNRTTLQVANPPINSRLIATAYAALTVYFPPNPSEGSRMHVIDPYSRLAAVPVTVDGNGHLIEAAATMTLNTNGQTRAWFFRADLGVWTLITNLALTDTFPFPAMFDDFFTIYLAMRLNPRYGRTLNDASAMVLKNSRRNFVARYLQSQDLSFNSDLARNTLQTFDGSRGYDACTSDFNRG